MPRFKRLLLPTVPSGSQRRPGKKPRKWLFNIDFPASPRLGWGSLLCNQCARHTEGTRSATWPHPFEIGPGRSHPELMRRISTLKFKSISLTAFWMTVNLDPTQSTSFQFPVSSFQFPVSSFQFPVSSFQFETFPCTPNRYQLFTSLVI